MGEFMSPGEPGEEVLSEQSELRNLTPIPTQGTNFGLANRHLFGRLAALRS